MRDIQQLTWRVDDNQRVVVERDLLAREIAGLRDQVVRLEQRKLCLTYNNLKPSGVLGSLVKEFTFFPDFDCNGAFLKLINYGDNGEKGLCENLVHYSKVGVAAREAAETLRKTHNGRKRKLH